MIYLSGTADPFASKSFRKFLINFDKKKFPNVNHIHLHTNGLLLTKSMWEQLSLAANMQRWWADNQVSCTITFNPATEGKHIASALDYFQYQLKGISFLPKCDYGAYPQMPYEEITGQQYTEKAAKLRTLNLDTDSEHLLLRVRDNSKVIAEDPKPENYCDSDTCKL